MTPATAEETLPVNGNVARARKRRRDRLVEVGATVQELQAALEKATSVRDREILKAHGNRWTGHLSYEEIAQCTGISKGRVIQIVTRDT